MKLTVENVRKVLFDCFFLDGEDRSIATIAYGVRANCGFHPERLAKNTPAIVAMIDQLPAYFKEDSGGGASFLQMCLRADSEQWADMHTTMDALLTLGLAIGKMGYCAPRELWQVLPDGMPYIVVYNQLKTTAHEQAP